MTLYADESRRKAQISWLVSFAIQALSSLPISPPERQLFTPLRSNLNDRWFAAYLSALEPEAGRGMLGRARSYQKKDAQDT
ncbi:MAG: hypothetical protein QNJ45_00260 [Ardenticatenaceae bacterium]|nr:hypothetical protein [Ardenticatenaceae bacterium]